MGPRLVDRASIRERSDPAHLHPRERRRAARRTLADRAAAPPRPRRSHRRPSPPRRTRSGATAASTSSTSTGSARRPVALGRGSPDRPRRTVSMRWWPDSGPAAAWWSPSTVSWPPWPRRSRTTWSRSAGPPTTPTAPTCSGRCSATPTTSPCSTTPSPSTRWWSTCRPGASVADPVVIVHVVSGRAAAPPCSPGPSSGPVTEHPPGSSRSWSTPAPVSWPTGRRTGRPATVAPVERLVVPVTELQVDDDASLAYVSIQSLGPCHLADRPPGEHHRRPRRHCRATRWRSAAATPGCAPTRRWRGTPGPAACAPRSSVATTRCSTSAPSRTTWRPAPRATCCSWGRSPTRPTPSTAG